MKEGNSFDDLDKNLIELYRFFETKVGYDVSIEDFAKLQIFMDNINKNYDDLKVEFKQLKEEKITQEKFFGSIIHDVRGPLNAIMGYTELALEKTKDSEAINHLSTVLSGASKATNLADSFVSYKNVLAGKEINKEEFILNECFDSIYSQNKIIVENNGLEMRYNKNLEDSIIMNTDKQLFERIFDNLISNAVKFTQKGWIELGVYETIDNSLKFYVEDTGIGISSEYQDKVFDMKTQVNKSDSSQGMGYGLSIVKDFVTALGGQIKVNSQPDLGSTFYFVLPNTTYKKL